MRTRALTKRSKKKKLSGGGLSNALTKFGEFGASDQGSAMMNMGAGAVGMAGDAMTAGSGARPSLGGGALSGAGKGFQMGMATGNPFIAGGAALVGGVAGLVNAKKGQEDFDKLEEAGYEAAENNAMVNSAAILKNYMNKGTGVSSFAKGGITETEIITPIAGGSSTPISEDAVEFNGYNSTQVDGIELDNAFVDDGESAKLDYEEGGEATQMMVFSEKLKLPGTKESFSDAFKKIEKTKNLDSRFASFNALQDKKGEKLFALQQELNGDSQGENPQEAIAGGMSPEDANFMGNKVAAKNGGYINMGTLNVEDMNTNLIKGKGKKGYQNGATIPIKQDVSYSDKLSPNYLGVDKSSEAGRFIGSLSEAEAHSFRRKEGFEDPLSGENIQFSAFQDNYMNNPQEFSEAFNKSPQMVKKYGDAKGYYTAGRKLADQSIKRRVAGRDPERFVPYTVEEVEGRRNLSEKDLGASFSSFEDRLTRSVQEGQPDVQVKPKAQSGALLGRGVKTAVELENFDPMAGIEKADIAAIDNEYRSTIAAGGLDTLGDYNLGKMPSINKMEVGRKQRVADAKGPVKKAPNFQGIGDAIGTYGSDIANLFTKTPGPTMGKSVGRTKLERMDNKEELSQINRGYRGAVGGLKQSAQNVGSAASSLFAKGLQAKNASNARTNKENIAIGNREASIQAQQMATDAKKLDIFNEQVLGKKLSDIKNRSTSLANMSNKFIGIGNEKRKEALDKDKIELYRDTYKATGVGERGFEDIQDKYKSTAKYGGLIKRSRKRKAA